MPLHEVRRNTHTICRSIRITFRSWIFNIRERQTDSQTGRQRERDNQRERESERERVRNRQTDGQRQTERQAGKQTL